MKKYFSIILVLAFFSSCVRVEHPADEEPEPVAEVEVTEDIISDGVFIHISHGYDDPQRMLMALNMATMMSEDKDVAVYIDISGVNFILKDAEDINFGDFPSAQVSLGILIEKGVDVMVCPGCLNAAGKNSKDVIFGVKIAEKDKFFNFTEGRIITLDY